MTTKRRLVPVLAITCLGSLLLPASTTAQSCSTEFDCLTADKPICLAGTCAAGPSTCVGDDSAEAGGDDGPAGARSLNGIGPVALTGSICGTPFNEADYYKVTNLNAGRSLALNLSWSGAADLDLAAFDATGRLYGISLHQSPENVALTHLPVGTYYIRVLDSSVPGGTASTAYTITATTGVVDTCTSRADCAATFGTQVFRGVCQAGACVSAPSGGTQIPGGDCDNDSNCSTGLCSYFPFAAGAERSICTVACTTTADCTLLNPTFRCTTGFAPNRCVAPCGNDLECGADPASGTVNPGQPWDYHVCTLATSTCGNAVPPGPLLIDGFES